MLCKQCVFWSVHKVDGALEHNLCWVLDNLDMNANAIVNRSYVWPECECTMSYCVEKCEFVSTSYVGNWTLDPYLWWADWFDLSERRSYVGSLSTSEVEPSKVVCDCKSYVKGWSTWCIYKSYVGSCTVECGYKSYVGALQWMYKLCGELVTMYVSMC